MTLTLLLKLTGVLLIGLAALHGIFPHYFDWKRALAQLTLINRQIMIIHTFFIGLAVFLVGLLCISSAELLVSTTLGHRISCGLGCFWLVRLWVQFFGFSSELWRGKRLETMVHALFTLVWVWLASVFFVVGCRS